MVSSSIAPQPASHESSRERARRHHDERAAEQEQALPWKVAAAVLFAAWVVVHAWLWHSRGIRPRLDGLHDKLTIMRWLSAGALLWVFLYTPLCFLLSKCRSLKKPRDKAPRQHQTEVEPRAKRPGPLETSAWTLPILATLVGVSLIFTLPSFSIAMGTVAALAAIGLLPWLPLVLILRRAFPGGRSELVMASLLLFFVVGLGQSVFNRGFYKWTYHFGSITFVVPQEAR